MNRKWSFDTILTSSSFLHHFILKIFKHRYVERMRGEHLCDHHPGSTVNILLHLLLCLSIRPSFPLSIHQYTAFFNAFQNKLQT